MELNSSIIKKEPNDYSYEDIRVGQVVEFEKTITESLVSKFVEMTGDRNPLHTDKKYASTTQFKEKIVHGMLAASFFSTLVGMYCPGKRNLYLSQTLNFKSPLTFNKKIKIRGEIKQKIDALKIIVMKTTLLLGNTVIIDGEAKVKLI